MKKRYLVTTSGRLINFPEGSDLATVRDRLRGEDYEAIYAIDRREAKRLWVLSQMLDILLDKGEIPGFTV
jgi:hypothetical protein